MNDLDDDRLSKYECLDAFGRELLRAQGSTSSPRSRSGWGRRAVTPLVALGIVGVPVGLAVAGVIGDGHGPPLTAADCKSVTVADKKVMRKQLETDPATQPSLGGLTYTDADGTTVDLQRPEDAGCLNALELLNQARGK